MSVEPLNRINDAPCGDDVLRDDWPDIKKAPSQPDAAKKWFDGLSPEQQLEKIRFLHGVYCPNGQPWPQ